MWMHSTNVLNFGVPCWIAVATGNMWPFTRKGGLSKFHAMPIFTVQAVKVRKIFGMWVKFLFHAVKNSRLPWKFHAVKKFIIGVKIFHAVKIFSHCEINSRRESISRREECASISCEKMSRCEKGHCLWRKSTHAKYRKHFTCLSHANFQRFSASLYKCYPKSNY